MNTCSPLLCSNIAENPHAYGKLINRLPTYAIMQCTKTIVLVITRYIYIRYRSFFGCTNLTARNWHFLIYYAVRLTERFMHDCTVAM